MKKKLLILTVVIASITSIYLTSCKKEKEMQPTQKSSDPTEQSILNFKTKVASGLKSAQTISVDSAVWYIEAALNYSYCIAKENQPELNDYVIDSTYSEIVTQNSTVNFADVANTFNQLSVYAQNKLNAIQSPVKRIVYFDVEFVNNKFFIRTMFGFGAAQKSGIDKSSPFTAPMNCWLASGELSRIYNNHVGYIKNGYYTDFQPVEVGYFGYKYSNPASIDPNFCYYYTFQEGGSNYDQYGTYNNQILTVTELNFYYNSVSTQTQLMMDEGIVPTTKVIRGINLHTDGMPDMVEYMLVFHAGQFTYATPHQSTTPTN